MQDPLVLSVHALMGVSLAACTGLRAFMPLFVVGMLARFGHVPLEKDFWWLANDATLVVFGIATAAEMIGDTFPTVDHAMDALATLIKPVAATLLFAAVMADLDPLEACVLGLMAGGTTATVLHLKKASLRLISSAGTFGLANPVISIAEDLLCGGGIAIAVMVPAVAMMLVIGVLAVGFWAVRRLRGVPDIDALRSSGAA